MNVLTYIILCKLFSIIKFNSEFSLFVTDKLKGFIFLSYIGRNN